MLKELGFNLLQSFRLIPTERLENAGRRNRRFNLLQSFRLIPTTDADNAQRPGITFQSLAEFSVNSYALNVGMMASFNRMFQSLAEFSVRNGHLLSCAFGLL